MKITRRQLQRIIQEELTAVLNEQGALERAGRSADSYLSGETGGLGGRRQGLQPLAFAAGGLDPNPSPYGDPEEDPRLAPTRNVARGGPANMLEPHERAAVAASRRGRFPLGEPEDLSYELMDRGARGVAQEPAAHQAARLRQAPGGIHPDFRGHGAIGTALGPTVRVDPLGALRDAGEYALGGGVPGDVVRRLRRNQ